jgi:hypothetical protein
VHVKERERERESVCVCVVCVLFLPFFVFQFTFFQALAAFLFVFELFVVLVFFFSFCPSLTTEARICCFQSFHKSCHHCTGFFLLNHLIVTITNERVNCTTRIKKKKCRRLFCSSQQFSIFSLFRSLCRLSIDSQ